MEWYVDQDKREALNYSLSQIVPIVPIALVKRAGAREEEGTKPSVTNLPHLLINNSSILGLNIASRLRRHSPRGIAWVSPQSPSCRVTSPD